MVSESHARFRRRFRKPTFSPIDLPPLVPYAAASLPSLLTGSLGVVTLLSSATMEMLRLPLPVSCAFALNSALDSSVCFLFLATGGRKPALDLGPW